MQSVGIYTLMRNKTMERELTHWKRSLNTHAARMKTVKLKRQTYRYTYRQNDRQKDRHTNRVRHLPLYW